MVRRFSVGVFKEPAEMKPGKTGFVGDLGQVNTLSVVAVNKQLGLHDTPVEVQLWILLRFHVLTNQFDGRSNISDNPDWG